jgi:hypothetical protein
MVRPIGVGSSRTGPLQRDDESQVMKSKKQKGEVPERTPHEDLAREATDWDAGRRTPRGFTDAPDAVPRARESVPISLRMPKEMLDVLRKFAERENVGYQVLIKRWLDDRIRSEREQLRARQRRSPRRAAPRFPLEDRPATEGSHYRKVS